MKAVFFDLDDTLLWDERSVEEAFHATCLKATEKYGVDASQLEEAVRNEAKKLYQSYETYPYVQMIGINPFEALWSSFSEWKHEQLKKLHELVPTYRENAWYLGLKSVGINDVTFAKELALQFGVERRKRPYVYEDTFTVLKELKKDYRLLLLTNGDPSLQKEKLQSVPELVSFFEHIVISGEFGKGKPDVSIFEHALSLMEVKSEEAVMIGDKLSTDILGANQANIPSIWLNRKQLAPYMDVQPAYEINSLSQLIPLLNERNVKNG